MSVRKPHAIILTERKVPEPIFIAAMIGVDKLLRIDFDLNQGTIIFANQAIKGVRHKLSEWMELLYQHLVGLPDL
jgi:hypothetical protein